MKLLEEKIKENGIAVNEHILKVDSFINHQIDPVLMQEMGKDIAEHFKDKGITKVATIESSGIAPALMTSIALGVPMIILKKQPSKILNQDLYQTVVTSFTKETNYEEGEEIRGRRFHCMVLYSDGNTGTDSAPFTLGRTASL